MSEYKPKPFTKKNAEQMREEINLPFEDINDAEIIHLSNSNCIRVLESHDELKIHSLNSLRLLMAKQILGLT